MPKDGSQIGPMNIQPVERASNMAKPAQPMMPAIGTAKKDSSPKREPTPTETLRAAIAKITKLNSLRKQRGAQKT
jgi:hypothetical protein